MEGRLIAKRYEIIERIGGGGMAVVYKAMDQVLDRYVAVKVLHDVLHHEEGILRFIREAKNAGRLSHPNIVSVYDAGREGEIHYIIMEYMEGNSLKEWMEKKGPLSPEESITIAMQICDGLAHAHKNGIIHRDIKPHNILCAPDGQFKITDFGISFFSKATQITETGMVMGSVHYFSPEQASGAKVDHRSDLYSLGVVLYEMVTGQVPFDADSFLSIVLKHVQAPVPNPQQINPEVPGQLCRIIFKAMHKDPNHRFHTAGEMKQALQQALNQKTHPRNAILATSAEQVDDLHLPRKKKAWKQRVIMAAIFVTFVSFAVLIQVNENDSTANRPPASQKKPVEAQTAEALTNSSPKRTELNGTYRWWREIPDSKQRDRVFRHFRADGTDGEYDVQLEVGNLSASQFYYNIYVVDRFSSRLILKGKSVPYRKVPEKNFVLTRFHVSIPEVLLPGKGIVKIEIYSSKDRSDAVEFLLQQWGHPPKK
ncbi:protein kinase domain-containing protein [Lihuaxuella thermophila]|uniref:non-specific serine/threonine protein kinase n=1 Tax=Lihuaxuella thermophila TaxID=1173111 RepID=A0A1H8BRJ7_9BACL|nr:protein kinase [Lihuaxuella thermophila]SEM85485.1 Serine/threonine protein kinase [Lihuaxuella thermophila]